MIILNDRCCACPRPAFSMLGATRGDTSARCTNPATGFRVSGAETAAASRQEALARKVEKEDGAEGTQRGMGVTAATVLMIQSYTQNKKPYEQQEWTETSCKRYEACSVSGGSSSSGDRSQDRVLCEP